MRSNLVFHRVRIGGLELEALMSADGPALVVPGHDGRRYEGWAPLGVSHLCWLRREEEPGLAHPRATGWHLVKYSQSEARAYLPGFGPTELERLREEFGLLTGAELRRGWSGEPAFYSSRAWAALVRWVTAHPQLAHRYANYQAYLPGWYDRAQQAARRGPPRPKTSGIYFRRRSSPQTFA